MLLQVTLCLITKVLLLKTLGKVEQVLSSLQHRLIDFVKHGWHFPLLNFFTFKIFLLSKTLLPPIMSLPSRQILVPRTSRGRPPLTSPKGPI